MRRRCFAPLHSLVVLYFLAAPAVAETIAPDNRLATELQRILATHEDAGPSGGHGDQTDILRQFYEAREFLPLWVDEDGLTDKATVLVETLRAAPAEGLAPARYAVPALTAAQPGATAPSPSAPSMSFPSMPLPSMSFPSMSFQERAELELDLSRVLLRYASDLTTGQVSPRRDVPNHYIYPQAIDPAEVLEGAAVAVDLRRHLDGLAPPAAAYGGLRRALAHYRTLETQGGWRSLADGPKMELGGRDPRVPQLRERLRRTGDLASPQSEALEPEPEAGEPEAAAPGSGGDGQASHDPALVEAGRGEPGPPDPNVFDPALAAGVRNFQERHGLLVDGIVGPRTLAALNVPVAERIQQIILNMERWRWMPRDLGDTYVLVNMAGFELEMVEDGQPSLSMRVVVGKPYQSTPVFSDEITYLEMNPYWNIPESITENEILPKVKQDPGYLSRQGIRILTSWSQDALEVNPWAIDWSQVERFPFRLRQDPGPNNPLGRIKFMLPNRFAVYLHDTPSRSLFQRTVRTFSHGCIRLEKPAEFAYRLLEPNGGWSIDRIRAAMAGGKRRIVTLSKPVPVHLTYSTAWSSADGRAHFRRDIYGRDALLSKALFGVSG